mgnify:CR=1 FL=1|mmetsp:Transcript_8290/g.11961  ORF Transcript_8290/g.11961 Transcript_8290/m.11961 type:complete len:94 (+) Transcript_8290:969-1250(+)|eukprot:scaffold74345_cov37-Tisochrysis_lutea.AAC.3
MENTNRRNTPYYARLAICCSYVSSAHMHGHSLLVDSAYVQTHATVTASVEEGVGVTFLLVYEARGLVVGFFDASPLVFRLVSRLPYETCTFVL